MAKPFAKLVIGYSRHQKFISLSGNAWSLWHEAKDYCEMYITDGIIPIEALKTFRFASPANVAALTRSCGTKPNGEVFRPLWETHTLGYRMHDFLEYNDCRDLRMERISDAEDKELIRKVANKDRQAKYRAERKVKLAEAVARSEHSGRHALRNTERNALVTPNRETPTATATATATKKKNTEPAAPPDAAALANHPIKEFLTLYEQLFRELFHEAPNIVGGRDAKIAKTVLDKYGREKAHALLLAFFASSDAFIQASGYGLNVFSGQLNKLIVGDRPVLVATGTDGRGRTGAPPPGKYDGIEEQG